MKTFTAGLLAFALVCAGISGCSAKEQVRVEAGSGSAGIGQGDPTPPGATGSNTIVTAPSYKPGQVTDVLPTRASALAALRRTQEGGVLRKIDELEVKLSTVEKMRRVAPDLRLPLAWPGAREVWVYLARGQIDISPSGKLDSWMVDVLGGPYGDPIFATRSGGPTDPIPLDFAGLVDRAKG